MGKRLYRSKKDSMIGGVCAGLGEYFDLDPVIMRLIFVLLVFAGGAGLIGYVIAWIIIPEAPPGSETPAAPSAPTTEAPQPAGKPDTGKATLLAGAILIILGVVFLFVNTLRWFGFWEVWPVVLIVIGGAIVLKARRDKNENPASA